MLSVIEKLPVGWSLIEDGDAWKVFDEEGELVCTARNTDHLNRMLNTEFAMAQQFATFMYAASQPIPAEA
jgi:hypothetical protein|tara:strand:+ start:291 stop:500 length:210 start_codon:yes stop_codon:yes gene_type:complete